MPNSTPAKATRKPQKPRPDFPLFPHASGRWAKKVRGQFAYFGKVADDPKGIAAEQLWSEQRDDLYAGRKPRVKNGELTVKDVVDTFLTAKELQYLSGDIIKRTFDTYKDVGTRIADAFGRKRAVIDLRPSDFEQLRAEFAKTFGPTALGVIVSKVRTVFKYACDADLIDRPIKFGPHFKGPGKKARREVRNAKGERLFTPDELRTLIDAAPIQLRAMILLGVNCGFGNHDCAALTFRALDLDNGWINFPRPKNGIQRRSPIWKETIEALRGAIAVRKEPNDQQFNGLVFISQQGFPFVKDHHSGVLGDKFMDFSKRKNVYRKGMSFYALRHAFETIGGDSRDQVAVNALMGHVDATMAGEYRERIEDERLRAVVNHIHKWLFGDVKKNTDKKGGSK